MNPYATTSKQIPRLTDRSGVSILEVIACTALVAVMMIPISGVIRASGQAISQSDLDSSTEARMRGGLRWFADAIRDGSVLGLGNTEMKLTLASGKDVKFTIIDGDLVMTDGTDVVVVAEDVQAIQFAPIHQSTPPNALIGINMTLTAADPVSGKVVAIQSMVAIPGQGQNGS